MTDSSDLPKPGSVVGEKNMMSASCGFTVTAKGAMGLMPSEPTGVSGLHENIEGSR